MSKSSRSRFALWMAGWASSVAAISGVLVYLYPFGLVWWTRWDEASFSVFFRFSDLRNVYVKCFLAMAGLEVVSLVLGFLSRHSRIGKVGLCFAASLLLMALPSHYYSSRYVLPWVCGHRSYLGRN
jgi:hypothetical protein